MAEHGKMDRGTRGTARKYFLLRAHPGVEISTNRREGESRKLVLYEYAGKMRNDFAQLSDFSDFPEVISGEALLRMTTKFYKLRDVRQHVCRLRKILANPPKQRSH